MSNFAHRLVGWYPGIRFAVNGPKRQYRIYFWKRKPPFCKIPIEFQLRYRSHQKCWVAYKTFPIRVKNPLPETPKA